MPTHLYLSKDHFTTKHARRSITRTISVALLGFVTTYTRERIEGREGERGERRGEKGREGERRREGREGRSWNNNILLSKSARITNTFLYVHVHEVVYKK